VALFAAAIIARSNPEVRAELAQYRAEQTAAVQEDLPEEPD
jgi:phosphoribosylcarboxyaminoimidazole (NCAIR) mutase